MLESVGPLGYVIKKLSEMRESGDTSQARFEAIEIIEALIIALVAVATARISSSTVGWKACRAVRRGDSAPSYC